MHHDGAVCDHSRSFQNFFTEVNSPNGSNRSTSLLAHAVRPLALIPKDELYSHRNRPLNTAQWHDVKGESLFSGPA